MRRALLIALAAATLAAAPAEALTLTAPDGETLPPRVVRWTRAMRVPPPSSAVVLHVDEPCPAYLPVVRSCAYPPPHRPDAFDVYLAPPDPLNNQRWFYYHELGHVFGMERPPPDRSEAFANRYAVCAYVRRADGCATLRREGGWAMTPRPVRP